MDSEQRERVAKEAAFILDHPLYRNFKAGYIEALLIRWLAEERPERREDIWREAKAVEKLDETLKRYIVNNRAEQRKNSNPAVTDGVGPLI